MPQRKRVQITPELVEHLTEYSGVPPGLGHMSDLVADLQGVRDALESVSPARLRDIEPQYVAPLPTPQTGGGR